MSTAGSVLPVDETSKSFGSRFVGVFLSPGETFADIVQRPDFIAPLLINIAASVALIETMLAKIGVSQLAQNLMDLSGKNMTDEQRAQGLAAMVKFLPISFRVTEFIIPPIFLLIVAGLGILFVNVFFGGATKFKTAFSIACYAGLISVLSAVIGIVMILFGDNSHFNPNVPVPTNLGFFFNPLSTSKPLYAIMSSIDVFYFWYMGLWGIGYSEASGRKAKASTIAACFFGVWLLILLIRVLFAAM